MRWISIVLFFASGCSLLNPGGDTRTAAEARSMTTWDSESNLTLEESTTHNRRVVMAESAEGTIEAEYYADGTPKRVSGATQLLSQWSEPKDVMGAYTQLAERNAQVAAEIMGTLRSVLPLIIQRPPQAPSDPTGDAVRWWESLTPEQRDAIEAIQEGIIREGAK